MLKNSGYIMSLVQEITEIAQVLKKIVYRLFYGKIARHQGLGDKTMLLGC
jgi:hypothetical protein